MPTTVNRSRQLMAFSLLREMAGAISTQSPDRTLQVLLDGTVAATESRGALLMTPHEKLREMVPLIESLPSQRRREFWADRFPSISFDAFNQDFLAGKTRILDAEALRGLHAELVTEATQAMAIPVRLAGKSMGLLFIFRGPAPPETPSTPAGPYLEDEREFLEIVTPFMATLIENVLLTNELIHKSTRLSALYEISQTTESLIDLRDVYEALKAVVRSFIDLDAYSLHLLGPDGQTLESHDPPVKGMFAQRIRMGEGLVGKAALERKSQLSYTEEFKSVLVLPMVVSGKLVGVVSIGSRKSYAYRDEDIIGLRIITTQIASIDVLFKDLLRLRGFTQHILQSMNSGVLIFDEDGKVTFSNPAMAQILARSLPEGVSPTANPDLFPEKLLPLLLQVLGSKLAMENARVQLDGTTPCTLEVNAFPFRDETGLTLGTAVFCKDITQIIRLEEQLKRADRLSALGVLAAGVAHEIRNPLTGMKMIVQLLSADLADGDTKREPLNIIQNEIERLERIIVNLLDFARPIKPQISAISLPDILDGCLLLLKNQINKTGLTLNKVYPPEIPPLQGDAGQLKQVFLNILTNAIQASKSGGVLEVAIQCQPAQVVAAIRDTGVGIRSDRLRSIFDPFVTTKEDGTGLGLSVALRIMEEHGGHIEVDSALGVGSTFSVHLPRRSPGDVPAVV